LNCKIIYLSLAGNTKLAAENIRQGIQDAGHDCELVEMRDLPESLTGENLAGFDVLGFMSPVYAWRDPIVWQHFLARLPRLDNQFVFIGATAGSDFGNYFHCVGTKLAKKGAKIIGCVSVLANPSFVPWNLPNKSTFEWDPKETAKAVEFGTSLPSLWEAAKNGQVSRPSCLKVHPSWALLAAIGAHNFTLHTVLGKKRVDEGLCIMCGICAKNCAWGAISMSETSGLPQFNESACGGCCTCINICPEGAISTKSTRGKVRAPAPGYNGYKQRV
jgi:ferredoxin